jgi:23S rRNA pseudouridine2457 synthase
MSGRPRSITLGLNKPFDVLTQFTLPANAKTGQLTLASCVDRTDVYPIGRLDRDSEGLLILSNDRRLQNELLDPLYGHPRTYLVQVEGIVTVEQCDQLSNGIVIEGRLTRPAKANPATEPDGLWARTPPIRHRLNVPTSWLELTLTEGRNRQVRKMTAAVGLPCLRLIRRSIGRLDVFNLGLSTGEWATLDTDQIDLLTS